MKRDEFGLPARSIIWRNVCVWDVVIGGVLALAYLWLRFGFR